MTHEMPPEAPGGSKAAAQQSTLPTGEQWRNAFPDRVKEQLGIRGMVSEYLIPVETNTIWYTLGGVLAISLTLELLTGMLLGTRYIPDAAKAYQVTDTLLHQSGWSVVLNFHYWNAYLIFALVMIHMMRVFFTGGYRGRRIGLWQIGVGLAGTVALLSITGETLHWDERGFAVPWHMAEILEAVGLDTTFNYAHPDLMNVQRATELLQPYYVAHISVLPLLLLVLMAMHYYLIKVKGISQPFWHPASGKKVPFTTHVREWFVYGGFILGAILVVSFFPRGAGPVPQLLPGHAHDVFVASGHGPGGQGIVPTFPISWTHGMNRFVNIAFGMEPDIWGTIIGLVIMALALILVPYLDRGREEPRSWAEALSLRTRGWAFGAMAVFWIVLILGTVVNIVSPIG